MKPDIEPDILAAKDAGEGVGLMEPMVLGADHASRPALADMALELAQKSTRFRSSLPPAIVASLADLVRAMNCYYSNLIEGHDTHPIDIERALKNDYSQQASKRNLQMEAKAHIAVQAWIDAGGLAGKEVAAESLLEIHRRFYENVPEELKRIENPETKEIVRLVPGALRQTYVSVGQHVSISPGAVPRFLAHFETAFGRLGRAESILAVAAAHHRLVWIHPFLDGNGRVARLMSHAMLLRALDTGGLWSIARGLARQVGEYKVHLANCDLSRRNELDGRGTLSEEMLTKFTEFFLRLCIDQVEFMERLMRPEQLQARILLWAEEEVRLENLPPKSELILKALLFRGEILRSEIADILNVGERQSRRVIAALAEKGVLSSASTRSPIHLAFPATLAGRWLPGLFPEKS